MWMRIIGNVDLSVRTTKDIHKRREHLSHKKSRDLLEIFFLFFDVDYHIFYISYEDLLALIAEV